MSANVPAHTLGSSSSFERKAPYNNPPSKILGDTKWCRNCERCHEKDMCQLSMVERLIDAGFQERHADISRLLLAGWERRHSQNLRALQLSRATNSRVNGGNTASASQPRPQPQPQPQQQQPQQTGPTPSQVSEGLDEVSDSEDPSDYEHESNVDGESDSDTSESAPALEITNAKEKSDTGNFKESEESFCFFALLPIVFLIILCAFWGYLGAKFGLRLGLVVYGV